MAWKLYSDRPIYAQLVEKIQQKILSGEYVIGQRLPSTRDLAAEIAVNPNTLQRAFAELERIGLVYTQRTGGRFIADDPSKIEELRHQRLNQCVAAFLEQIAALGYSEHDAAALISEAISVTETVVEVEG